MTATLATTTCPDWCTDHRPTVDGCEGDVVHAHTVATTAVGPIIIDQTALSEGVPTGWLPEILLPIARDSFGPGAARELAAALLNAADQLDAIDAGVSA